MGSCKYCGLEFEGVMLGGHIPHCRLNPNYEINKSKFIWNTQKGKIRKIEHRLLCKQCQKEFIIYETPNQIQKGKHKIFCSQTCSCTFVSRKFDKKKHERLEKRKIKLIEDKQIIENVCLCCSKSFDSNNGNQIFCSESCSSEYKRKIKINEFLTHQEQIKSLPKPIRRWLLEKNNFKCQECGWGERNPFTGLHPLEIEHIDGNSENNKLENLKVLCARCHSMTATYKGANRGNGRYSRKMRFRAGKSY